MGKMKKMIVYPKNKKKFIKLMHFAKQVINICKNLKITPVAYGSLAVFIYTKNRNLKVNDIDFLIHEDNFKKIITVLEKKKIRYNYSDKWHVLQIFRNGLKIEIDSIEFWQKNLSKTYEKFKIDGFDIRVLGLKDLTNIYKKLSKIAKKNRGKKHKTYIMLKNLK